MERLLNIVFYTPVNFRCRDIESLAKKYAENGHQVFLLSQNKEGSMHESFRNLGMMASSANIEGQISLIYLIKQWFYLIRFCKKNSIHIIFSHLEPTNFVTVMAQYFIDAKVIIYRHHINEARLYNFDKSFTYKLTYWLAKKIICVSRQAKSYMIREEKVPEEKIVHINLGYDFSLYESPDEFRVKKIREEGNSQLLLVSVGRLTKFKRHEVSIELIRQANLRGINASLFILGVGEEEEKLREMAIKYAIQNKVIFVGYSQHTMDYLAAADLLIHPSVLESSCVVIKEASLVNLPVVVCKGVGDFDDYIEDGINGFALNKENFVEECLVHIKRYSESSKFYKKIGAALKQEIKQKFSIDVVFSQYQKFLNNG